MRVESKFDMGQRVYGISTKRETKFVSCPSCDGTGVIYLKDEIFTCPKCYGRQGENEYTGKQQSFIEASGVIGQIRVEVGYEPRITYMLDSTGIGSGTLWDEKHLFASKEEALEYCKKQNDLQGVSNDPKTDI